MNKYNPPDTDYQKWQKALRRVRELEEEIELMEIRCSMIEIARLRKALEDIKEIDNTGMDILDAFILAIKIATEALGAEKEKEDNTPK